MSFFENQSPLTWAKIEIYKEYITRYLPKVLQGFGSCLIADLFCGAGKSGDQDGSPLVLISQAKYILTSPNLRKHINIEILFNDKDQGNSNNLRSHLGEISHESITIRPVKNVDFQTVLFEILREFKNSMPPKFFFLDPFKYSDVTIDNLRNLMSLPNSEVLLFTPLHHSYRFSNAKDFAEDHQTRKFVEEFTTRGMADYDGIDDYMNSIKEKMKSELRLDYVRPILLDDGKCKNAIFLLTKHRDGMLEMNKVAFRKSPDGKGVNVKLQLAGQGELFGAKGTPRFHEFAKKLELELKVQKSMSNAEIVEFTIREGFLPKHVKDVLIELCAMKNLSVVHENINITGKASKWCIAEKITKEVVFTYVD